MLRNTVLLLLFICVSSLLVAQELNCKVVVNADQISTSDRQVFRDMEISFAQFMNGRKWSSDAFQNEERIKCHMSITIDRMPSIGSFQATVQIQSARPVFNSNYESILLNFGSNVVISIILTSKHRILLTEKPIL